jgi:hypothetical protein
VSQVRQTETHAEATTPPQGLMTTQTSAAAGIAVPQNGDATLSKTAVNPTATLTRPLNAGTGPEAVIAADPVPESKEPARPPAQSPPLNPTPRLVAAKVTEDLAFAARIQTAAPTGATGSIRPAHQVAAPLESSEGPAESTEPPRSVLPVQPESIEVSPPANLSSSPALLPRAPVPAERAARSSEDRVQGDTPLPGDLLHEREDVVSPQKWGHPSFETRLSPAPLTPDPEAARSGAPTFGGSIKSGTEAVLGLEQESRPQPFETADAFTGQADMETKAKRPPTATPLPPSPPAGKLEAHTIPTKVQPASEPNHSEPDPRRPAQAVASTSASSVKRIAADAPDAVQDRGHSPDALGLSTHGVAATSERGRDAASTPESQRPTAPAAPADPLDTKLSSQARPSLALKDVSFQVTQSNSQKVQVRLVEQSGELRVAVHSGDSELTHGLRQGLSDLVERLQDNGFRADAWRPSGAGPLTGSTPETRSADNHHSNSDSQSQPGWSQQDRGRQDQNHFNRPRWVEELESSLTSGGETAGGSYGITN